MQKKFVSSLLLLLFLNLLIKPVWIFGIDLTVQNRVGATEYGLYAALFSFSMIFNILLDLGLTHFNNQAVAKNRSELVKNFSYLTSLKLFLGLLYFSVTLIVGLIFGYHAFAFKLLLVLSINQFLSSLLLFLRSHISGLHYFKSDSILSVLDKALMILSCGVLLFIPMQGYQFTIMHFALAQLGSYLVAVLIAFFMVRQKARIFSWRVDFKSYKAQLLKSYPYAFLILLMALYTRVDGVMIERMVGPFENGVYAQAFRLLDGVNQFGYLIGILLLPIFSGMIGRKEDTSALAKLSFSMAYVVTVAITLSIVFNAYPLMDELYKEHSELSTPVLKLLIASSIAFGTTYVFGTLLTANQNLKSLNILVFSGFVLNIILNFLLIPKHGAQGAAMATLATQFSTAIGQVILSIVKLKLKFSGRFWLRFVLFTIASLGLAWSLHEYANFKWSVDFVMMLMGTLLLSLIFRLLNYKAAIDLIRMRFK